MNLPPENEKRRESHGLRFPLAVGLCVAGAFIALFFFTLPPREPVYRGKPLSYWTREFASKKRGSIESENARMAIKTIGTNAIPFLVHSVTNRESVGRRWAYRMSIRYLPRQVRIPRFALPESFAGLAGLQALGDAATNAIPLLVPAVDMGRYGRLNAAAALRQMKPHAGHALVEVAVSTNVAMATGALDLLGVFVSPPPEALTVAIRSATNANSKIRYESIFLLSRFTNSPIQVLPILEASLRDPEKDVRAAAAFSFGRHGSNAVPYLPALFAIVTNDDWEVSIGALDSLGELGANAVSAVPLLLGCLSSSNSNIVKQAREALTNVDPDAVARAGIH
ncbi:MAG: HEAT repeat domain-containing protein [Verrucomicrobia bacterium]|nr:HEAT repeat domain-containing protein [Verrucomicrobiota bacterium]